MLHKQVSFIIDSKGNKQAAVVPIEIYNELMTLQKALSDNKPGERELYHFNGKGAEAHGYPVGKRQNPGFMVLAGSTANGEDAASLREAVIELRQELLGKGILTPRSEGGFCVHRRPAVQQPEPGRQSGGGQQPQWPGCLAKQRWLHPQAVGLWQEIRVWVRPHIN